MTRQKTSIAYTLLEASVATSIGKEVIRAACDGNDLPSYWVGNKRVIRAVDLEEWITTLPTTKPG